MKKEEIKTILMFTPLFFGFMIILYLLCDIADRKEQEKIKVVKSKKIEMNKHNYPYFMITYENENNEINVYESAKDFFKYSVGDTIK